MAKPLSPRSNQPGFSLIELLVALAISMFLLLGIAYIYSGSKQTYRVEENLARMQESGRLAMQYLSRDIRMAGDFGCVSKGGVAATATAVGTDCASWPTDSKIQPVVCTLDNGNCAGTTAAKLNFNPARSIFGFESSGPSDITTIAAKTDSIIVTSSTPTSTYITSDSGGKTTVNSATGLSTGDILFAADCKSAVIFQACTLKTTEIDHTNDKSGKCAGIGNVCAKWDTSIYGNFANGSILKAIRNIYYIKGTSLYRRDISNTETELVSNIENLQITYGVAASADASASSYVAAGSVTDWGLVKSVHIELLIRSPDDNLTAEKQKYFFNDADVTATDNRIRLVMGSTVGIRNRTLSSVK